VRNSAKDKPGSPIFAGKNKSKIRNNHTFIADAIFSINNCPKTYQKLQKIL